MTFCIHILCKHTIYCTRDEKLDSKNLPRTRNKRVRVTALVRYTSVVCKKYINISYLHARLPQISRRFNQTRVNIRKLRARVGYNILRAAEKEK